jgi:hypothetical protein
MGAAVLIADAGDLESLAGSAPGVESCLVATKPAPTPGTADLTIAASTKSAKTAGGVIRLGGRGPFHAFLTDGLGRRNTGGEDEVGLPLHGIFSVRVGDDERARSTFKGAAAAFLSHDLDSAVGYPMLTQKFFSRSPSPWSLPSPRGNTRGTSSRQDHATSSAMEISPSPSSSDAAPRRSKREPDPGDPNGGRAIRLRREVAGVSAVAVTSRIVSLALARP